MRLILFGALCVAAGCSNKPPEGSLGALKQEARGDLIETCMQVPERYGFPNTRAVNADLVGLAPGFAPNVYTHCRKVAQLMVP